MGPKYKPRKNKRSTNTDMNFLSLAATWGPAIINAAPKIINASGALYEQYCKNAKDREERELVRKSLEMLTSHKDDLDQVLQDPEQRRAIMTGLAQLMVRIQQASSADTDVGAVNMPQGEGEKGKQTACSYSGGGSMYPPRTNQGFAEGYGSADNFKAADFNPSKRTLSFGEKYEEVVHCPLCTNKYDSSHRRPIVLPCGHTFCKACLREVNRREVLRCPNCRQDPHVGLEHLPTNLMLLDLVTQENNMLSGPGGVPSETSCEGMCTSYEAEIQHAIYLSLLNQNCNDSCAWGEEHNTRAATDVQEALSSTQENYGNEGDYYASASFRSMQNDEEESAWQAEAFPNSSCSGQLNDDDEAKSLSLAIALHEREIQWARYADDGCKDYKVDCQEEGSACQGVDGLLCQKTSTFMDDHEAKSNHQFSNWSYNQDFAPCDSDQAACEKTDKDGGQTENEGIAAAATGDGEPSGDSELKNDDLLEVEKEKMKKRYLWLQKKREQEELEIALALSLSMQDQDSSQD